MAAGAVAAVTFHIAVFRRITPFHIMLVIMAAIFTAHRFSRFCFPGTHVDYLRFTPVSGVFVLAIITYNLYVVNVTRGDGMWIFARTCVRSDWKRT